MNNRRARGRAELFACLPITALTWNVGSPPFQGNINDPERVKQLHQVEMCLPPSPLFKQVGSIYMVDYCLCSFSKGGRERKNGDWELYIPCYFVSSLGEIKKAEEGKTSILMTPILMLILNPRPMNISES